MCAAVLVHTGIAFAAVVPFTHGDKSTATWGHARVRGWRGRDGWTESHSCRSGDSVERSPLITSTPSKPVAPSKAYTYPTRLCASIHTAGHQCCTDLRLEVATAGRIEDDERCRRKAMRAVENIHAAVRVEHEVRMRGGQRVFGAVDEPHLPTGRMDLRPVMSHQRVGSRGGGGGGGGGRGAGWGGGGGGN